MHISHSWSNSVDQHSWRQRSSSTSLQRTVTHQKTECMNASMEEMDWSDTCLDSSNNSFTSPGIFRQSSYPSASWKNHEKTSPSSLLSSLNIAEFPRPQPFTPPRMSQNFDTSARRSSFQLSQSMSKLSQPNLSSAKPTCPLAVSDLSSIPSMTLPSTASMTLPPMKLKLPFTTSELCSPVAKSQTSFMQHSAFHRTLYDSFSSVKNSPSLDHDLIQTQDWVPEALGNESLMQHEDESFHGNKTEDKTNSADDLSAEESSTSENRLRNTDLKKPRRSVCSCLFRVSFYTVLAVLLTISAMLVPCSYFRFCVCDADISMSRVHHALTSNVFGQHLAVQIVSDRLGIFLNDSQRNLLVLSFQGWTGIGKNHMSNILAQFVPPGNVHRYIVTLHFTSNVQLDVENWMREKFMASCGVHLFVMDEMDKASDVFVSGLRQALHSTNESLSSHPHTRAIVLLLSNTGSTAINTYTAQVLEEGVLRENIAHDGLMNRLETALQHTWYSQLMRERLIDEIVPFLPLEKAHVEMCAVAALGSRQLEVTDEIISAVLNRLSYSPLSNSMFSTTGCRKVNAELDLVLY